MRNKYDEDNEINDKYIMHNDSALYQSIIENGAHAERLSRFNGRQGHGYAAEQANDLIDKIHLNNSKIVGDDNKKGGPDRNVNGVLIQTKYCQTAQASVGAAFKNGIYKYIDYNGNPMQIEVPRDQYAEAVKCMEKYIADGKVPGVTDPKEASNIIRKGNIDYKTAVNISKAGNIDSLMFDAAHGTVIATQAMGISGVITYARCVWNGYDNQQALEIAAYESINAGGIAFVCSIVTSQVVRTSANSFLLKPSIKLVKLLPSKIRHILVNSMRKGALIYGAAATNNLAKLVRSNFISASVTVAIMTAEDVSKIFQGRMSSKQLLKNVTILVSSVVGGYVGSAIGTVLMPGVGTVIGGIVGSSLSGEAAQKILDSLIEDDVVEMLNIINDQFIVLAQDNLLSQEELELSVDEMSLILSHGELLNMFASDDRKSFANRLCENAIHKIICFRARIITPTLEEYISGIGHIIEPDEKNELDSYFKSNTIDAKTVGRNLLGRDAPSNAVNKAWYVTKNVNNSLYNVELILMRMRDEELSFTEKYFQDEKELRAYRERFNSTLKRIGG